MVTLRKVGLVYAKQFYTHLSHKFWFTLPGYDPYPYPSWLLLFLDFWSPTTMLTSMFTETKHDHQNDCVTTKNHYFQKVLPFPNFFLSTALAEIPTTRIRRKIREEADECIMLHYWKRLVYNDNVRSYLTLLFDILHTQVAVVH